MLGLIILDHIIITLSLTILVGDEKKKHWHLNLLVEILFSGSYFCVNSQYLSKGNHTHNLL